MYDVENSVAEIVKEMKRVREDKHLSQLDLSLASGVSQTMISQIESGKKVPTLSTFLKLCSAMNVGAEVIMHDALLDDEERRNARKIAINIIEQWI